MNFVLFGLLIIPAISLANSQPTSQNATEPSITNILVRACHKARKTNNERWFFLRSPFATFEEIIVDRQEVTDYHTKQKQVKITSLVPGTSADLETRFVPKETINLKKLLIKAVQAKRTPCESTILVDDHTKIMVVSPEENETLRTTYKSKLPFVMKAETYVPYGQETTIIHGTFKQQLAKFAVEAGLQLFFKYKVAPAYANLLEKIGFGPPSKLEISLQLLECLV